MKRIKQDNSVPVVPEYTVNVHVQCTVYSVHFVGCEDYAEYA